MGVLSALQGARSGRAPSRLICCGHCLVAVMFSVAVLRILDGHRWGVRRRASRVYTWVSAGFESGRHLQRPVGGWTGSTAESDYLDLGFVGAAWTECIARGLG